MQRKAIKIFGWYGAFALLAGYALISFGVLDAQGMIYQLIVLTSCAGLVAASLVQRAYQPAVVNAVSVVIAFVAIAVLIWQ